MRPRMILHHYARTWLIFDSVVIICDWITTIIGLIGADSSALSGVSASRIVKSARVMRISRLVRLARFLKVHSKVGELIDQLQQESIRIILGIVKLLIIILLVNHCNACGFYWIGTVSQTLQSTSWLQEYDMESRSLWYRYSSSLHWSLSQFTPASMEIFPKNEMERTFTICTLLFALVTFSSFIGSLTNSMTQLRNLNSERQTQFALLRRYFRENGVSIDMTSRLWSWLHANPVHPKIRLHAKDIQVLSMLPSALQVELWNAVYVRAVIVHPLFFQVKDHCPPFVRKLNRITEEISLGLDKELFQHGDSADKMYFVVRGTLNYYRGDGCLVSEISDATTDGSRSCFLEQSTIKPDAIVSGEQWLCELSLWTQWHHAGRLEAATCSELLAIYSGRFHQLVCYHPELLKPLRLYAQMVVHTVNLSPGYMQDVWHEYRNTR